MSPLKRRIYKKDIVSSLRRSSYVRRMATLNSFHKMRHLWRAIEVFLPFHACPLQITGLIPRGKLVPGTVLNPQPTLNKRPSVRVPSSPVHKLSFGQGQRPKILPPPPSLPSLCHHRFFDDCGSVTEVIFAVARGCETADMAWHLPPPMPPSTDFSSHLM